MIGGNGEMDKQKQKKRHPIEGILGHGSNRILLFYVYVCCFMNVWVMNEERVLGYETRLDWGYQPGIGVYDLLCLPSVAVLLLLLCHIFLTFYESTYHNTLPCPFFFFSFRVLMPSISVTTN